MAGKYEEDDDQQYLDTYDSPFSDVKHPADDEQPAPCPLVARNVAPARRDPVQASEPAWARLAQQLSDTNLGPRREGQLQPEVVIALQKMDVRLLK